MARIHSFLRLVVEQQASDLHFHAGKVPIIRYQGDLIKLPFRILSKLETRRFLYEMMTDEQREALEQDQEVDFVYVLEGVGRFRANVFVQHHGLGAVFRVIPYDLPTLDDLFMPNAVKKLTRLQNGLVLVTGPTGSGKSTTMAAMVHEINCTSSRHIISIEDPIEFIHRPVMGTITQRQVGKHAKSFESALRSALRESPDVLVVGEMRDLETVSLALMAAETGVLVLGTLHTNSAAKAIHRIMDVIPPEGREQVQGVLSILLQGVLAQRLCKRSDEDGRIAILEVLLHNYAVANMIREDKIHLLDSYLKSANPDETGMQSFDRCLYQHIIEEFISLEEATGLADDPRGLQGLVLQHRQSIR